MKTRMIFFRVTPNQHERIRNNAEAKGHKTVSGYLRELALKKDMFFEQKILEMHKILTEKWEESSTPS